MGVELFKRQLGEPVLSAHLIPYHKPRCSLGCKQGIARVVVGKEMVAGKEVDKVEEQICNCAVRRFLREHPEILRGKDGSLYYPAGGGMVLRDESVDSVQTKLTDTAEMLRDESIKERFERLQKQFADLDSEIKEVESSWTIKNADRLAQITKLEIRLTARHSWRENLFEGKQAKEEGLITINASIKERQDKIAILEKEIAEFELLRAQVNKSSAEFDHQNLIHLDGDKPIQKELSILRDANERSQINMRTSIRIKLNKRDQTLRRLKRMSYMYKLDIGELNSAAVIPDETSAAPTIDQE